MSDYGNENTSEPRPVWLTRDECIERYSFDPTGYPENVIKSKLTSRGPGRFCRVWLENEIATRAQ